MNKAEMKAGGTLRVKNNKVIKKGEEILFAYHSSYWSRWGAPRRGRPTKHKNSPQTTAPATPISDDVAIDTSAKECNLTSPADMSEQIAENNGVRVVPVPPIGRVATNKRGRRRKERDDPPMRVHKRQATQYMWTATSRDEFDSVQQTTNTQQDPQSHSQRWFERGEGGGVT